MATNVLARLRSLFESRSAVKRVADDPALTAELLLLFRMILADGRVDERELVVFKRICAESFGIGADDLEDVVDYLQDYGYETSGPQALDMFQSLPDERKRLLALHLGEIARADSQLDDQEMRLLKRTLAILHIGPEDFSGGEVPA